MLWTRDPHVYAAPKHPGQVACHEPSIKQFGCNCVPLGLRYDTREGCCSKLGVATCTEQATSVLKKPKHGWLGWVHGQRLRVVRSTCRWNTGVVARRDDEAMLRLRGRRLCSLMRPHLTS